MKKLFLLLFLIPLFSCSDYQSKCPDKGKGLARHLCETEGWSSYATSKRTKELEFWVSYYDSRDACMKDMYWQLESGAYSENSKWYTKPYGCHFFSNNKLLSLYNYFVYKDENLGCLWETYNPNSPVKYSRPLKPYVVDEKLGQCIVGN